ncbi:MAG TPA: hypothetical protein VJN43_17715 [Bryobacteraceae bacterium]|nr:hypothetical protein [Bryobacteraceae bacterium]
MHRTCLPAISFVLAAGVAFGQTPPAETDTLRSLLSEVHQLRQALETTLVTGQRLQIALYRLQIQTLSHSQAAQRLDAARSKVADAERSRRRLARQLEDMENLQNRTEDPRERAARELDLHRTKKELEFQTTEEQQLRTIESDALAQVQTEQAKLSELQDGLTRLDKTLASQSQP